MIESLKASIIGLVAEILNMNFYNMLNI